MLLRKKFFKSALSILLVLLLAISCMPITASAESLEIVDIEIEPIYIPQYSCGYNALDYDYDLSYYRYTPEQVMTYTITLSDGSEINGRGQYVEEDSFIISTNQSYENQWVIGNTYIMTATFYGHTVEVPVTITESPIKSINIEPINISVGSYGYYKTTYEPEQSEYFYYEPAYIMVYSVTLNDGTVIDGCGNSIDINGGSYRFKTSTNQSYNNQWVAGNTYTMSVTLMEVTVEVPVTITKSPIKSVEINPLTITEYTNGFYNTDYNPDTDSYDLEYFYYQPVYEMTCTVTFSDGTIINTGVSDSFEHNGEYYNFTTYSNNQSYENQWTAGNTYYVKVSLRDHIIDVPVTIIEAPTITSIEIEPITITEYTNGCYVSEGDDPEYFRYDPEYIMEYTITFNDGTVIEDCGTSFEYNDNEYSFDFSIDQSYYNQWTAGNTYTMNVKLMDFTMEVPVTITLSPVKSIEIEPITLIALADGQYFTDYNPETDDYDLKYYHYNIEYDCDWKYHVTLSDDTVISGIGKSVYINGENHYFKSESNQSYENQWTAGNTYKAEVSLLGISTEVEVTIIESPVKDIIAKPITLYSDIDSYTRNQYNPETDEYDLSYKYYSYINGIEYTVLWNDGTQTKCDGYKFLSQNNKCYYSDINDNQSYYTPWEIGNTYNATLSILGKTVDIPITIKDNPINSIDFIKAPDKTEYVAGELLDIKGAVVRVNYADNTYEDVEFTEGTNAYSYYNNHPVYLSRFYRNFIISIPKIYADPQSPLIKIEILGKEIETKITVSEKTVDSVSISGDGIDLDMEFTYSDGTKLTTKVLDMEIHAEGYNSTELVTSGFFITNNGIFYGELKEVKETEYFYVELYLKFNTENKTVVSNKLTAKECSWFTFIKKISTSAEAIGKQTSDINNYNGELTAKNIDELLSVACSENKLNEDKESYVDIIGSRYVFYADRVKESFIRTFGFTPDLTLSSNYNANNNTVNVNVKDLYGKGFKYPVEIEQNENNIKVTIKWNSFDYGMNTNTITFDNNFNIIAFNCLRGDELITGDANNDGVVNVSDVTHIQKYLADFVEFSDAELKSADVDGDSIVSVADTTDIQKMLAGLI